jgi:hypothetical protein
VEESSVERWSVFGRIMVGGELCCVGGCVFSGSFGEVGCMGVICAWAVHVGEVAVSESLCRGVCVGALLRWSNQRRTEGCAWV